MSLVTGLSLKKTMTFGTFDAAAVRGAGGLAQTERAAMLTSGTMFFNYRGMKSDLFLESKICYFKQ